MNTQILHQISCLLFLLFFLLCALHDGRTKSIPAGLCRIFFGIGVPIWLLRLLAALQSAASPAQLSELLLSFLPGLLLLLLYRLTGSAIGSGDGLFLLIGGCYLPLTGLTLLLITGIILSGLLAILLLSLGRLRRRSMRKAAIPFIPCMLPGLCLFGSRLLPHLPLKEYL